jgi:ArsR family transcriptional regulator
MRRVVRPGGIVAICDAVEHPYEWMRTEHADVWLGFREEDLHQHFAAAGLNTPSIQALGMQ